MYYDRIGMFDLKGVKAANAAAVIERQFHKHQSSRAVQEAKGLSNSARGRRRKDSRSRCVPAIACVSTSLSVRGDRRGSQLSLFLCLFTSLSFASSGVNYITLLFCIKQYFLKETRADGRTGAQPVSCLLSTSA